jgi:hypothetical protein
MNKYIKFKVCNNYCYIYIYIKKKKNGVIIDE